MRKILSSPRPWSRSRDKLRAAAAVLLDQRDPVDITITDLANEAGVSRPTFYAVYGDLSEAWADAAVLRRFVPWLTHALVSSVVGAAHGSDRQGRVGACRRQTRPSDHPQRTIRALVRALFTLT